VCTSTPIVTVYSYKPPLYIYSFAALGSLSNSLYRRKYPTLSGFMTVLLGCTSFPLITCLTTVSTFLPLIVTGISGTSNTNCGT